MHIDEFNYDLPESFIAQEPLYPRDSSKLMHLNHQTGDISHHIFRDVGEFLRPRDVLVMNDTRVIPARIPAKRADTGGKMELLLLRDLGDNRWQTLIGGKRAPTGTQIAFDGSEIRAEVIAEEDGAQRIVEFSATVNDLLSSIGQTPLPPYIHTRLDDDERYQTVYSHKEGSAAAPTAGLHFTPELLTDLKEKGIHFAYCTLHIGLDTFQPVRVTNITDHHIHSEYAELSSKNANIINAAKREGGRIIAVGTTTARTLESAAILSAGGDPADSDNAGLPPADRPVTPFAQDTRLYIYPGYTWRAIDGLITNFHLPKSTLLMMISSFSSRQHILNAYEIAKANQYRFFSFGDAMLIL